MISISTSIASFKPLPNAARASAPGGARRFGRGLARRATAALTALALTAAPMQAAAAGLIRDAEIENTLRDLITPIFHVAGVGSGRVRIFIINDDTLNAFVSASSDMFFHTGLLRDLETPEELVAVMAHETGHIRGGHFVQRVAALQNAQTAALIVQLLGVGAAVAGAGAGGVGAGAGLQRILERDLLRFTRSQESGADALGLQYMNQAGVDPEGMLRVLERLQEKQVVFLNNVDPYALSHPLSPQRIAALKKGVMASPARGKKLSDETRYWHGRMRAKLDGFLSAPGYMSKDSFGDPELDLYRRAIQLHRAPKPDEAIRAVDQLLKRRPSDPYYWELKGQILAESGRGPSAVAPYEQALKLAPDEPQIAAGLGKALLTVDQKTADKRALRVLSKASIEDPYDPTTLRLLAEAYAKNGEEGLAAVATARRLALIGRTADARRQAKLAKSKLPKHSPGWLQADDLEGMISR